MFGQGPGISKWNRWSVHAADNRIREMGKPFIDDELWKLIGPLLPPAKPGDSSTGPQACAESRSANGHRVRAEDRHSLARSSCRNGMWLGRELLAAAARLARGWRVGCIARVAADQTTRGKPDRLLTCGRRLVVDHTCRLVSAHLNRRMNPSRWC